MPSSSETTLFTLLADRVERDGDKPALQSKRDGAFHAITWKEFSEQVWAAAAALIGLGVKPGDRVLQLSENRAEWIECDLAIQFCGAVHVPVHSTLTGPQIAYQIKDSCARVVVLSSESQAAKLRACAEVLPRDLVYVAFDACSPVIGDHVPLSWSELKNSSPRKTLRPIAADGLATILYTSGTTGEPKGVMLSQSNLTSNTLATLEAFVQLPEDVRLTFLPFSHIFARTCDIYIWLATGAQLAIAESRETVIADCAAVRPTLLNGVPYFFDRVRRSLEEAGMADEEGSLQSVFGGRMRFCCSGGAALPDHVFDFYQRHGIPILQGYGLTETSPVITASTHERNRRGCVGPPIRDVDVIIADDGEILTRGPNLMMGYFKNDSATKEVIRDGWFLTGDLGQLDDDGMLRITGRKKELIVTAGGKNIAPVYLESLLVEDPLIVQAMIIGDGRNFLAALIVPDFEKLRAAMSLMGQSLSAEVDARNHVEALALIEQHIQMRLADVSAYEQVRRFALIDRPFTIETGELTPKLSLRRKVIEENYAGVINGLYK